MDTWVAKKTYTVQEWDEKENFYQTQINAISIPIAPTTGDIQQAAIAIDKLLGVARIDLAYINQKYTEYDTRLKIDEKRLFVDLKLNPPKDYSSLKLTVDEMKGVVSSFIANNPYAGSTRTLYDLTIETSKRYIFMQNVVKILEDKKDLLITHSGILKIESSVSNMSPNVQGGRRYQEPDLEYQPVEQ